MTAAMYNRLRMRKQDSGMAMISVIMLMLILSMLALMMLAMVLMQSGPTLFQDKNVRSLAAAQAGLDAAAFQIRHAHLDGTIDTPMGDIRKLPCTVSGPVEDGPDSPYFEVNLRYFKEDPKGQDSDWLDDNELECFHPAPGKTGVQEVARYAVLSSEGFDPTATATADKADRTLEANYTFQLTTRKIAGGRIWDDNNEFCWVAQYAGVNSPVRYRPSSHADCEELSDLNSWIWADDYMIHLASTEAPGVIPLCLSGRPHSNGNAQGMTLQQCTSESHDPLGQRFAWTGDHTWRGMNYSNENPMNSFIVVDGGKPVQANNRVSAGSGPGWKSVNPDPAVGKGNASYETDQVVNHLLFGRCLDVTDVRIIRAYMIAYPCKQDPSGGDDFDWNHKWYYDEPPAGQDSVTTKIRVIDGSNKTFCLISPADPGAYGQVFKNDHRTVWGPGNVAPYNGSYFPRFVTSTTEAENADCTSAATNWTRYGYSDDETYAYTIRDNQNRCLSAAGIRPPEHSQWTTIVVEPCTGVDSQKWNVPSDPVDAALAGFEETTGRSD